MTNIQDVFKILLIDDHPLFVDGLKHILSGLRDNVDITVAFDFTSAAKILTSNNDYDLCLLDMGLPDTLGEEAIKTIRLNYPLLPLVILSGNEDKDLINLALAHGVQGYIPKSTTSEVMISALNLIVSGGIYIPKNALTMTAQSEPLESIDEIEVEEQAEDIITQTEHFPPGDDLLTLRQQEILTCLNQGLSNKGIARKLNISEGTVRVHMSTIYRLLCVENRTQAIVKAAQLGLVNTH